MLAPGTPIITTPTTYAPIARLRAGDTVVALGGDLATAHPALVIMATEQLQEQLLKVTIGPVMLYCTPTQRFRTARDWVEAAQLGSGEQVLCYDLSGPVRWAKVTAVNPVMPNRGAAARPWKVWGLDIEMARPYVANGVVVL